MEKIPFTLEGFERLTEELKRLKHTDRPAVIAAIAEARGHGDLSENAEYHAAKEKQGFIEGRIGELENKLGRAEVIDVKTLSGDVVKFGAKVKIVDDESGDEHIYQIVGPDEGNLDAGLISLSSPLARALIGKKAGSVVEVGTPKGQKVYEVLNVKFG
jgi:transcription elongation factor GreA